MRSYDFTAPEELMEKLRALLGLTDDEAAQVVLKSRADARRGRRPRDKHGRVVHKPFAPAGYEPPEKPIRDHMGYRLNKPYDPRRQRRS